LALSSRIVDDDRVGAPVAVNHERAEDEIRPVEGEGIESHGRGGHGDRIVARAAVDRGKPVGAHAVHVEDVVARARTR